MSTLRSTSLLRMRAGVPAGMPIVARSFVRYASTNASQPKASSSTPAILPMPWSDYLAMRKRRKQWSTIATIPSSIASLFLGASYFASVEMDPSQMIMGLDPMLVYGGATLGCGLLGYLIGPSIGGGLFSVTHPKLSRGNPPPLEVMDREFYSRIKERRSDPSRQSVNNPAPDFYGEKIVSIPTYRRWLKDQKAYDRKAAHGVPGEEP